VLFGDRIGVYRSGKLEGVIGFGQVTWFRLSIVNSLREYMLFGLVGLGGLFGSMAAASAGSAPARCGRRRRASAAWAVWRAQSGAVECAATITSEGRPIGDRRAPLDRAHADRLPTHLWS